MSINDTKRKKSSAGSCPPAMTGYVLCWDCKNKMKVPGSAHIACAWKRGSKSHVWFYEGFDPNFPKSITECKGFVEGEEWMEEIDT